MERTLKMPPEQPVKKLPMKKTQYGNSVCVCVGGEAVEEGRKKGRMS